MGVGEFLSSKAHNEWVLSERAREKWELDNYPEGEIQEMIDIYVDRGMSKEDATIVITKMSKYSEFFVDVMMAEELQLQVPEDDHKCESMKEGLVMFLSFAAFGSLPIMGYVIIPIFFPEWGEEVSPSTSYCILNTFIQSNTARFSRRSFAHPPQTLFSTACAVTGIVLFMMGCVKSMFSTTNWFVSGMETFMLGGACATLAYVIGQYVEEKTGAKVRNCKERRDELATC
ncbi:hypothetical protein TL16_g03982 [Triparma laevis f. inornata]|uniref:Uncharacterized protein n=1 Tax=Triparma laevis f. inornata TaxID=1714386 RepID=A0A9W7AB02_9STRA|nr:hypothetical protein TL16_g03982 [Triparma laevis f. inornata]